MSNETREWFYAEEGKAIGPVPKANLIAYLKENGPSTLVWREGFDDWLRAEEMPELNLQKAYIITRIKQLLNHIAPQIKSSFFTIYDEISLLSLLSGFWFLLLWLKTEGDLEEAHSLTLLLPIILTIGLILIRLIWKRFGVPHWQKLPINVRRGLSRLYLISTTPSILWFTYRIFEDGTNRYRFRFLEIDLLLLIAPPLLIALIIGIIYWIIEGFLLHKPEAIGFKLKPEEKENASLDTQLFLSSQYKANKSQISPLKFTVKNYRSLGVCASIVWTAINLIYESHVYHTRFVAPSRLKLEKCLNNIPAATTMESNPNWEIANLLRKQEYCYDISIKTAVRIRPRFWLIVFVPILLGWLWYFKRNKATPESDGLSLKNKLEKGVVNLPKPKGSTALLILTIFVFPWLWMMDVTNMSMYWIARPEN